MRQDETAGEISGRDRSDHAVGGSGIVDFMAIPEPGQRASVSGTKDDTMHFLSSALAQRFGLCAGRSAVRFASVDLGARIWVVQRRTRLSFRFIDTKNQRCPLNLRWRRSQRRPAHWLGDFFPDKTTTMTVARQDAGMRDRGQDSRIVRSERPSFILLVCTESFG